MGTRCPSHATVNVVSRPSWQMMYGCLHCMSGTWERLHQGLLLIQTKHKYNETNKFLNTTVNRQFATVKFYLQNMIV